MGKEATISVCVSNNGGQEGTYTAKLTCNGIVVAAQDITLSPGESQLATFNITDNEPGNYEVKIGGLSGEFTSLIWINWRLIIVFSVMLLLIIWALWYYRCHSRKYS